MIYNTHAPWRNLSFQKGEAKDLTGPTFKTWLSTFPFLHDFKIITSTNPPDIFSFFFPGKLIR